MYQASVNQFDVRVQHVYHMKVASSSPLLRGESRYEAGPKARQISGVRFKDRRIYYGS